MLGIHGQYLTLYTWKKRGGRVIQTLITYGPEFWATKMRHFKMSTYVWIFVIVHVLHPTRMLSESIIEDKFIPRI